MVYRPIHGQMEISLIQEKYNLFLMRTVTELCVKSYIFRPRLYRMLGEHPSIARNPIFHCSAYIWGSLQRGGKS